METHYGQNNLINDQEAEQSVEQSEIPQEGEVHQMWEITKVMQKLYE